MNTELFFKSVGQSPITEDEIGIELIEAWKKWVLSLGRGAHWYVKPSARDLEIVRNDDRFHITACLIRELNYRGLLKCSDCGLIKPAGFWGTCLHCCKPEPETVRTMSYSTASAWLEIHEPLYDSALLDDIHAEREGHLYLEADDDPYMADVAAQVALFAKHFGKDILWDYGMR